MRINGEDYTIPELNFDAMCELEEKGVYLLGMDEKNPKLATMIRGFVAWTMNVPEREAGNEIQKHIMNGGDLGDILKDIMKAAENSGFFKKSGQAKAKQIQSRPQDFQRKKNQHRNQPNQNYRNTQQSQN